MSVDDVTMQPCSPLHREKIFMLHSLHGLDDPTLLHILQFLDIATIVWCHCTMLSLSPSWPNTV